MKARVYATQGLLTVAVISEASVVELHHVVFKCLPTSKVFANCFVIPLEHLLFYAIISLSC